MADKTLERLNAHRDWANNLYVEWFATLPAEDAYCRKMLTHVLIAEEVLLGRIFGRPNRDPWGTPLSGEEMRSLRQAHKTAWEEVLNGSVGDLSRVLHYKRLNGDPDSSTLLDMVTHTCMHGMYHRGQIAAHAARIWPDGPKLPPTDYIVFSRLPQLH